MDLEGFFPETLGGLRTDVRYLALADLERQIPLGHLSEVNDVPWRTVYLASDEFEVMTGAVFVIRDGITAM